MKNLSFNPVAILLVLLVSLVHADSSHVTVFKVKNTHDRIPFECSLTRQAPLDGCDAYYVRFQSPVQTSSAANNAVAGELFRPIAPVGRHSTPAVLVFHIIGPGTFQLERMLCRHLARNGVTAMFFHLPYYGLRGDKRGPYAMLDTPERFVNSLEQAVRDAHRAIDLLLSFPDVNPSNIGTAGVSLGSLMAATTAGLDRRVSKTFMILGAGNLPQIIANDAYETKAIQQFLMKLPTEKRFAVEKRMKAYDPITHADTLRKLNSQGRFWMVNADSDHVIPPDCSKQLAKATGATIHWLPNSDHYTAFAHLKTILAELETAFASDVPKAWRPPQPAMPLDSRLFSIFAEGFNAFIGGQPLSPDHCHRLKGKAIIHLLQGVELHLNFDYMLGSDDRFRLEIAYGSSNIHATAGQSGQFLWLTDNTRLLQLPLTLLKGKTLFDNPLVDARDIRLMRSATVFAANSPEMTGDVVSIQAKTSKDQHHTLTINSRAGQLPGSFFISYDQQLTPKNIDISFNSIAFSLEIHQWQLNVPCPPAPTFDPPPAEQTATLDPVRAFQTIMQKLFPVPIFSK